MLTGLSTTIYATLETGIDFQFDTGTQIYI